MWQPESILTPTETVDRLLAADQASAATQPEAAAEAATTAAEAISRLDVFNGYLGAFVIAFLVTLIATPIMRALALANGVVDHPENSRKVHRAPIAYLGGVAVYLGLLAAIAYAFIAPRFPEPLLYEPHATNLAQQPEKLLVILAGMTFVMLAGLLDDVVGVSPRLKIAGMLIAAAFLAFKDIGVRVAQGVLGPLGSLVGNQDLAWDIAIPLLGETVHFDLIYWAGTLIIALFVLGACNASNLIDGLDGLLTGVTAIVAGGLLFIALGLAVIDDGPLDSARIILTLGLLGATLGFLPYNFKPATIFLGDAGALLLGFVAIVIILTLGDTGKTFLVVAGLLIYALPIIDTSLAIVRRWLAGQPVFSADDHHLHHMLQRKAGVMWAVLCMYGITAAFALLGVLVSLGRARVAYALALVLASYIGVTAVKMGRRRLRESRQAAGVAASASGSQASTGASLPASAPSRSPAPNDAERPEPRLV